MTSFAQGGSFRQTQTNPIKKMQLELANLAMRGHTNLTGIASQLFYVEDLPEPKDDHIVFNTHVSLTDVTTGKSFIGKLNCILYNAFTGCERAIFFSVDIIHIGKREHLLDTLNKIRETKNCAQGRILKQGYFANRDIPANLYL